MRDLAKEIKPVMDEIAAKEREKFENREGIEERLFDSHVLRWEKGKTPLTSKLLWYWNASTGQYIDYVHPENSKPPRDEKTEDR